MDFKAGSESFLFSLYKSVPSKAVILNETASVDRF